MKQTILVVGASSRLGAVMAERFAQDGFLVYGTYNSNLIKSDKVFSVKMDIENESSIKNAIRTIVKKTGRIDVLINCAGITISGNFERSSVAEIDKLLNVNLLGIYRLIKNVLPQMKNQKFGRIINITSMSGLMAFPNFSIYSASKFAAEALVLSTRYELIKNGIYLTNVEPGAIKSDNKPIKMKHKTFRERNILAKILLPFVDMSVAADKIFRLSQAKFPPAQLLIGWDVKLAYFLKKFLPDRVWDYVLIKLLS